MAPSSGQVVAMHYRTIILSAGAFLAVAGLVGCDSGGLTDDERRTLSEVRQGCSREFDDEAVLAGRLLANGGDDLLINESALTAHAEEVRDVLELIRTSDPQTRDIHARPRYLPNQLVLGVEGPLKDDVAALLRDASDPVRFETGHDRFDRLNARLGLHEYSTGSLDLDRLLLQLCFDRHVNVPAAAAAYSELDGIEASGPNHLIGDGPNIHAIREGDTWYVVFRDAWGDCPAGCTGERLSFYTVANGAATLVSPEEAEDSTIFAGLIDGLRALR